MISARTKAALAAAKARGQALGGWRGGPKPSTSVYAAGLAVRQANARAFAERIRPMVVEMRERGLSLGKIAAELTKQGIRTPRDGNWAAGMVQRILRAEESLPGSLKICVKSGHKVAGRAARARLVISSIIPRLARPRSCSASSEC